MNPIKTVLMAVSVLGTAGATADASILFTFSESGGNVIMQSSGVLNTANLFSAQAGFWGDVGIESNNLPDPDIMGDTTMGGLDAGFRFSGNTDLSAWFGDMFTGINLMWSSTGTTQFATYYLIPGLGRLPGISLSSADLVGGVWTPDLTWTKSGTLANQGLTPGTYAITDNLTGESITIQIGAAAVSMPEPDAMVLFASGLAGLCLFGSRRRANRQRPAGA